MPSPFDPSSWSERLSTETVKGSALPLEGVDDVERGDGLTLGVLGVGDGVTDDVLEAGVSGCRGDGIRVVRKERGIKAMNCG